MTRSLTLMALLSLAIISAPACSDDPKQINQLPVGEQERSVVELAWDTIFQIGGTESDTLLQMTSRPVADSTGFTVVDVYAKRVLRFDHAGRLEWTYGNAGAGPGEFLNPRDIALDREGRTWVLDPRTARITVIGADGRGEALIPLDGLQYSPDALVPHPDGSATLVVANGETPLVRIGPEGQVLEQLAFPWSDHVRLSPLAAQVYTANDPATDLWVAAYSLGDGFYLYGEGTAVADRIPFVEPVPFAVVTTNQRTVGPGRTERTSRIVDPIFAAMSVTVSPERIYVLFAGRSEHRGRIVDSYSRHDGTYIESVALPGVVGGIAYHRGGFIVEYQNPWPALAAWRPTDRNLP